jgi:hypothetical protein
MIAGLGEPANVGWIERLHQWMPMSLGQDRTGNHVHILAGKSFSQPDWGHERKIIQLLSAMSISNVHFS